MLGFVEIFYIAVGLVSVAPILWVNRHLFSDGLVLRPMEWALLAAGVPALIIGWYHNLAYFHQYAEQAGWLHWTQMLFENPASASGGQDLIFANLWLFPLWNMIDGRRHRMRLWWWYFPMSLLTSYAFGIALFMLMELRQIRFNETRTKLKVS